MIPMFVSTTPLQQMWPTFALQAALLDPKNSFLLHVMNISHSKVRVVLQFCKWQSLQHYSQHHCISETSSLQFLQVMFYIMVHKIVDCQNHKASRSCWFSQGWNTLSLIIWSDHKFIAWKNWFISKQRKLCSEIFSVNSVVFFIID